MNIVISNLRYADRSNNNIDMDVAGFMPGESIPFTYNPSDTEPLSIVVKELLSIGQYEIEPYTTTPFDLVIQD